MVKISAPTRKILLYYSAFAALFITISGFLAVKRVENASFQLIFLPVTMYLFLEVSKDIKSRLDKRVQALAIDQPQKGGKASFIVFMIIYIVLIGMGVNNIISAKNDSESTLPPTDASTPLIFKVDRPPEEKETIIASPSGEIKVEIKEEPLFDSTTLGEINEEKAFLVEEELDDWYKLILGNDSFGYIHKNFTKPIDEE